MSSGNLVSRIVVSKLKTLRILLRLHLVLRGLAWLIFALVVLVFVSLGVDYALHMDGAQRAVIMSLLVAGLGYVFWRFLLRPLRVPMDAEELALVIEQYHSELDDRLISLLQFASRPFQEEGVSETLVRRVADEANAMVEKVDPSIPIESTKTWKQMALPAVAVAILVLFTAFHSNVVELWFKRNVLFMNVPWPKKTSLRVEGGPVFRVVRGRRFTVKVQADPEKVVPEYVTFHMRFSDLGVVAENIKPVMSGGNIYVKVFENVAEPFEFYITGNDDKTDWFSVELVEPPELTDMKFRVSYPAYMNRPAADLPASHGTLLVPEGSRIALTGWANKDLRRARLILDDDQVKLLRLKPSPDEKDSSTGEHLRGIEGTFDIPQRPRSPSMRVQIELTDTEGIVNSVAAGYAIRIEPDRPPSVSLTHSGVRAEITSRAIIPLNIKANDDYGVAGVDVMLLCTSPSLVTATTGAASRPSARKIPISGIFTPLRNVAVRHELDLEPMGLKIGSLITLQAVVRDTLPETFAKEPKAGSPTGPNVSRSLAISFKIVSEDDIMAEVIRRQKEIRQELTPYVLLQSDIRDRLSALQDEMAGGKGISESMHAKLSNAASQQRGIMTACNVAVEGLIAILDEMNYNRVGSTVAKQRLAERIIKPLRQVSKKPMNELSALLVRASKEKDDAIMGNLLNDSARWAEEIYKQLDAVIDEMVQWQNRQELANRLKLVIDVATKVLEGIKQEAKRESGSVFERNKTRGD